MLGIVIRLAAALALAGGAGPLAAQSAQTKPPPTPPPAGQPGFMMVGERGLAFVPAQASPATPVPLLILFHGAGGAAQNMMKPFLAEADKRGFAMLAVQARSVTWDLIRSYFASSSQEATMVAQRDRLPAGDRRLIDQTIAQFEQKVAVDRGKVAVFGFSDGAAYALSYGAANSGSIAWVGAMAPAFGLIPRGARSNGQRVFIGHGTADTIIAHALSKREVCPKFTRAGWTVRYRSFEGGHGIAPALVPVMLDDWLEPAARPPAGSPEYRCEG